MAKDTIPTPPDHATIVNPAVDVQSGKIGAGPGYSGEEYDSEAHAIPRALHDNATGGGTTTSGDDAAIPPDNGKRASFDYKTGAVHGSGAGAGGGNEGEDFDSDGASGDGYPLTGAKPRQE